MKEVKNLQEIDLKTRFWFAPFFLRADAAINLKSNVEILQILLSLALR